MAEQIKPKLLLTVKEAAAEIGDSEHMVRQLADGGHLRTLRVGRNIRVHRASLEAFIAGNLAEARA